MLGIMSGYCISHRDMGNRYTLHSTHTCFTGSQSSTPFHCKLSIQCYIAYMYLNLNRILVHSLGNLQHQCTLCSWLYRPNKNQLLLGNNPSDSCCSTNLKHKEHIHLLFYSSHKYWKYPNNNLWCIISKLFKICTSYTHSWQYHNQYMYHCSDSIPANKIHILQMKRILHILVLHYSCYMYGQYNPNDILICNLGNSQNSGIRSTLSYIHYITNKMQLSCFYNTLAHILGNTLHINIYILNQFPLINSFRHD